jgi:transcriptional regulator with XRE-family HTH domain
MEREESLGETVRRLRRARGMTTGDLADSVGVSRPTVWAWEHEKSNPRRKRISLLAEALGVPEDALIVDRPIISEHDRVANLEAEIRGSKARIAALAGTTPDMVEIAIKW